jgi:hypothetical protein
MVATMFKKYIARLKASQVVGILIGILITYLWYGDIRGIKN